LNVIFDLGNVLLEWDVEKILQSLDINTDNRRILECELFFHDDWLALDSGLVSEVDIISSVAHRSGLNVEIIERAFRAAKDSLTPIPESVELLCNIQSAGFETYCLTNMSRETFRHIREYEFLNTFRGIVVSGIEECIKPNPEIFLIMLERYGLSPQNALFIDDSQLNIQTAQNLGMLTHHFRRSEECIKHIWEILQ